MPIVSEPPAKKARACRGRAAAAAAAAGEGRDMKEGFRRMDLGRG